MHLRVARNTQGDQVFFRIVAGGCEAVCDGLPDSTSRRTIGTASHRDAAPADVDLGTTPDRVASAEDWL